MLYFFSSCTSKVKHGFEIRVVNKYDIDSRITENNEMKAESTVYFNKLNHKKKLYPLKNLNIDTKIILQNATAKQGYCAKKTG